MEGEFIASLFIPALVFWCKLLKNIDPLQMRDGMKCFLVCFQLHLMVRCALRQLKNTHKWKTK